MPQTPLTSRKALPRDTRPIVISGPSGVGKGTLYNLLFERHPDTFTLSVSHTTRAPRAGEADGVHYHFVKMEEFEALIEKNGFVEHAQFGGNRYGTSKQTIEEQTAKGRVVLLDIEMEVRSLLPLIPSTSPVYAFFVSVYALKEAAQVADKGIGGQANQGLGHQRTLCLHCTSLGGDPRAAPPQPRHRDGRQHPEAPPPGQERARVLQDSGRSRHHHCQRRPRDSVQGARELPIPVTKISLPERGSTSTLGTVIMWWVGNGDNVVMDIRLDKSAAREAQVRSVEISRTDLQR